ncbi:HNH endonuclease signature motif containing protein [Blastococcus brunescens]|uniref:DUF222 domain-containing protein n=1 Tax=Blastococcus brunescens TaxID=1564165 RepID=A0ABZ1AYK2_9ACTN|nr:DUF222 domain-containing protein [Blastococcus sp. BMG 8361]WRL63652.1 DUF222 domain-containing protein [Blastococcus sp. BMG 8361]
MAARARAALPAGGRAIGALRPGADAAACGAGGVRARRGDRRAGGRHRAGGESGESGRGRRAERGPFRCGRRSGRDGRHPALRRSPAGRAPLPRASRPGRTRAGPHRGPLAGLVPARRRRGHRPVRPRRRRREKFLTAIESILQAGRCAGDDRTRAQQSADALVQLADNVLASGDLPIMRTVKPHVIVRIGIDDLVDPATGPAAADTGFGATISAARARWLACDGNISRVVMGPDGEVLDHGRTKRIVPPGLRRAVEAQQRHCVFTGCGAPTHWCDVHHVLEWVLDEGPTSLENSALLCERHHTKVHHGFRIQRDSQGRWHTYRPDGSEITIGEPPPETNGDPPNIVFDLDPRDLALAGIARSTTP